MLSAHYRHPFLANVPHLQHESFRGCQLFTSQLERAEPHALPNLRHDPIFAPASRSMSASAKKNQSVSSVLRAGGSARKRKIADVRGPIEDPQGLLESPEKSRGQLMLESGEDERRSDPLRVAMRLPAIGCSIQMVNFRISKGHVFAMNPPLACFIRRRKHPRLQLRCEQANDWRSGVQHWYGGVP